MPGKQNPIFAIGYSNYAVSKFIKILKAHGVTMLVDVRTIPKSRHQPDFNKPALAARLKRNGIQYMHFPELGGLRKPSKDSINKGWRNSSFRGFADYMQKREFATAIAKLIKISKGYNLAIMCAEGNPFRCHRSLIADALTVRHKYVYHISGLSSQKKHELTYFAKVDGTKITYPE
ncbi:MAG: DUF488 domain-containing protein [Candidatus Micrarchaeales archaeon]|nr:DUF488 domain-containing protein [Candidatus Micrarchaeales archaeon]